MKDIVSSLYVHMYMYMYISINNSSLLCCCIPLCCLAFLITSKDILALQRNISSFVYIV